jgi:hypothetical protein
MASDAPVKVTTTEPVVAVHDHGLYVTVAVGFTVSANIR